MIVRILGEGQFELDETHLGPLNELDEQLDTALGHADDSRFQAVLAQMAELVRSQGTPEPDDFLGASDLTLPAEDATRAEVTAMLAEDGLVPG